MEIKFFEIRDSATFIPAMAFTISGHDSWLAARAGFGPDRLIILMRLEDQEARYSPFGWSGGARTMLEAHKHIEKNWDRLNSGEVIDVEFVLGETKVIKRSEAFGFDSEMLDYKWDERP